jgi:hypothetical protein
MNGERDAPSLLLFGKRNSKNTLLRFIYFKPSS